jgi:cytochrome c oxidase cbb3-type subunit 1
VALAFYGMSTFEGPMMSHQGVNASRTIRTGPSATFIAARWAGSAFTPSARSTTSRRGCGTASGCTRLRLVNWHFWIATVGIVLYIASMWVAGIMQGLMWREYGSDGYLVYSFAEVVAAMFPMYVIRAAGGVLYLERSSWPTTSP